MKIVALVLALVCCAVACGDAGGPPPGPTPVPPEPTAIGPAPTPLTPCKPTGQIGKDGAIYRGDCQETNACKSGADGTFAGECQTRTP